MCPPASTQPTASKEPTPEQNGPFSQLISHLKSSFRPTDFESVTKLLIARDEAARKEISHWKAQYEAMEKKQGETAVEKIMTEDELHKLKRERDLLKDQVARAETDQRVWMERMEEDRNVRVARFREDQKESGERERKWKEMYEKLWEDFEKVETEKAKLGCLVSALKFEKEKAEREAEECNRRFENLNRRISRLEEDAAVLMSAGLEERREEEIGPEERREEGMGSVAVPEPSDEIFKELVMDGNEGGSNGDGSGNENVNELPVKEGGLNGGEKADLVPRGGGSAPGSMEVGSSHRENGSVILVFFLPDTVILGFLMLFVCFEVLN